MATIRVAVPADPKDGTQSEVLGYLHSQQVKLDFKTGWVDRYAANYGMEIKGGPRPVFEKENDRGSKILAYEQDFKLTRSI